MQLAIKLFATTHFRSFLSQNSANISAGQSWQLVHAITLKYENSSPLIFFVATSRFLLPSKSLGPTTSNNTPCCIDLSKETKVNSHKLNNPLETHKNENYFIGPPHFPPSAISPSGIPWFTIGDCNHASKRHVIAPLLPFPSPPPMSIPKTIQHGIESRDTQEICTHIGRNSSANKRDRKGQQESRLRDRRDRKRGRGGCDRWVDRGSIRRRVVFA